jgi:hypothetical protein
MVNIRFLRTAALAALALVLCACPEVDPVDPTGPDNPSDPGNTTPTEQPYFTLALSSGSPVPDPYVRVCTREEVTFPALIVKTNMDDWSATSSESWCTLTVNEYKEIVVHLDAYGDNTETLQPRICEIRVRAGSTFNQAITLVQESNVYISFANYGQAVVLPSTGATVEVPVYTNCYQWTPSTTAGWLTVEKVSPAILRIRSTAISASDTEPRSTLVTVTSAFDEFMKNSIEVKDEKAVLSEDDYHYGDHTDWD